MGEKEEEGGLHILLENESGGKVVVKHRLDPPVWKVVSRRTNLIDRRGVCKRDVVATG